MSTENSAANFNRAMLAEASEQSVVDSLRRSLRESESRCAYVKRALVAVKEERDTFKRELQVTRKALETRRKMTPCLRFQFRLWRFVFGWCQRQA